MTFTATQLAYRALRDLGCLRSGQQTSPDILNDVLESLNEMVEMWQLDELMIFAIVANIYPFTNNYQQYQIGPVQPPSLPANTAFIVAPRPNRIEEANVILDTVTPVLRIPLNIINAQEWSGIRVQQLPSTQPSVLYPDYNFDPTYGFMTLNFWPGPLTQYQMELYTWQQLQQFADLVTPYQFPPAYLRVLRTNLAVQISPMMKLYNKLGRVDWNISEAAFQELKQQAVESKAQLQSYNARDPVIGSDPSYLQGGGREAFNWLDGLVGRGQ